MVFTYTGALVTCCDNTNNGRSSVNRSMVFVGNSSEVRFTSVGFGWLSGVVNSTCTMVPARASPSKSHSGKCRMVCRVVPQRMKTSMIGRIITTSRTHFRRPKRRLSAWSKRCKRKKILWSYTGDSETCCRVHSPFIWSQSRIRSIRF